MAWVATPVSGVVLWAACGVVLAFGREVWPGEMTDAVRLAMAPAVAAAVTIAARIASPGVGPAMRAAALTIIVGALDAWLLAPLIDARGAVLRARFGFWAPLAAIFLASWIAGRFAPV